MGKRIRITCEVKNKLSLDEIADFQGNLKVRTAEDVEHIISSIERFGFSFPFFIWVRPDGEKCCLDGHGRILALKQMRAEGYDIPMLPVVEVEAEDEAEARRKLIMINTQSGNYSEVGFRDLVKDIPDLDLASFTFPDLDLVKIDNDLAVLRKAKEQIEGLNEENPISMDDIDTGAGEIKPPKPGPIKSPAPRPESGSMENPVPVERPVQVATSVEKSADEFVCCPKCGKWFAKK